MKKVKKDNSYMKAVKFYEEGNIEKAIQKCDEAISNNLRNSAAINLKGLLLYLKGDLNGAVTTWKINSDYNDDKIAKNYIFDSKSDTEKINMYKRGELLLKSLAIDEALIVLNKCAESDFNAIKVNLSLALCYQKKGDYNRSAVYVSKVLGIDKYNKMAKSLAKEIESTSGVKLEATRKNNLEILVASIALIIIVIAGTFGVYKTVYSSSSTEESVQASEADNLVNNDISKEDSKESIENNESEENVKNEEEQKGENSNKILVNYDELNNNIESKDYDAIYSKLKNINPSNLEGKQKTIYYKAKELLENDGVVYFYKQGTELFNKGDIEKAKEEFQKGYDYGKNNYLYQHILFFNAAADEKLQNTEDAIKEYEEYYRDFKNETYIAETTYKLALLYKNIDIDKSVSYAREVREKYSDSMYNNDVISNLLGHN
ncbi:MAG: tetratricopeptide repeat protein [Clostridiaceae bacterium]|nr:tetratricopeptide repeat protein [Clostridiaceae bacterium]